ncbi:Gfo/Idh/MocA family oxidoreductase [candidate division KSB1 bacterium]|nr:Gfo/Idh/MocA family oxidoreductase [candidate division KSB1 bacterium]
MSNPISRRDFLEIGTAAAAAGTVLISCSANGQKKAAAPAFLDAAPDGNPLKAGLIGCGGRGTGAALNFLSAGPNLSITALGDVFSDRLENCRQKLIEEKQNEVAREKCFVGFDAFQKVIDSGVDIVILATPPHFRPEHFAAAVDARKNVFMEKPLAVDPVGIRSIIASSKRAEQLGLTVGTGTQRRHQRDYVSAFEQIKSGAIGEIVSANCYWNQSQLWFRTPQSGWSEMEYMIRDWVNWCWLSGDHIVEQHIHNIDVINWFTQSHPTKAVAFGARQRRVTGDQYDMFSVDFEFENGMHVHSMCRQIDGCANNVSEFVMGTKGYSDCRSAIHSLNGTTKWEYDYAADYGPELEAEKAAELRKNKSVKISPYVQEHIDLVTAIRNGKPYVEAEQTAVSNMTAIMGRVAAYTGKAVTWDEMMNSDLHLGPKSYSLGPVELANKGVIPTPGTEKSNA